MFVDPSPNCLLAYFQIIHSGHPVNEECLFQTPDGFYFVYVHGGEDSPYPDADILRLGKAKVEEWLKSRA